MLKNIMVVPVTECSVATKITLWKCLNLHQGNCSQCYRAGMEIRFQTADAGLSNFVLKTCVCMHAKSLQSCLTLCDPMDYSLQAPLSMGFSRQEYCSGLPGPSPGDLPDPGNESMPLTSSAMRSRFCTTSASWGARSPKMCAQTPRPPNWKD